MRATLGGYYRNLQFDQTQTARELFDVTKQISSGQKIQYAHEGIDTFVNTVRLDNEVTTLSQIKQTSTKALQFSTNTDTTMNEMTKIMDAMKVKLVNAANDSNGFASLQAIAADLRGMETNLKQLANTSIDGKYLFSGSETSTKPIDENGVYQGNNADIKAFVGSGVQQTFNINGADLFLGSENDTNRKISLNIPQLNQKLLNPYVMTGIDVPPLEEYISESSSIRELMGDNDSSIDSYNAKHNFYLRGTGHDGTPFKSIVSLKDSDSVADLMKKVGEAYGNTPSQNLVNVTINNHGQIEIEDKRPGSSKLDFHMIASTSMSYEPRISIDTGTVVLPAPTAPLTDASRISVPLNSVANGVISAGDTLSINGNIYTVATPLAAIAHPTDPTKEVISLDANVVSSPLTNIEMFKSTGFDFNNDVAANKEFNRHGVPIKDFMNSDYTEFSQAMNMEQDIFVPNKFTLSGDFITKEGAIANKSTLLTDVFSSKMKSIEFTGRNTDGTALAGSNFFDITSSSTIDDLMKAIDSTYDPVNRDVLDLSFIDGKIQIGKSETFEFRATQPVAQGQNTIDFVTLGQNYTPFDGGGVGQPGDTFVIEGDTTVYTIDTVVGSTITLLPPQTLEKDVLTDAKITLTTGRSKEFDIQLEAYALVGGAAAAGNTRVEGLPSDSAMSYDEVHFLQDKNRLTSDVPQIIKLGTKDADGNDIGNQYAVENTKLIDVAGTNSFGLSTTPANKLSYSGVDILGNAFDVTINLRNDEQTVTQSNAGLNNFQAKAYFSVTTGSPAVTTDYPIFNVNFTEQNPLDGKFTPGTDSEILTAGDNLTYKQLNDIINMVATASLPKNTNAEPPSAVGVFEHNEYFNAVQSAQNKATTALDANGRIVFEEKGVSITRAEITLADANASDMRAKASVLEFNSNNTITVRDAKTDFFTQLDQIISTVEAGRSRPDGTSDDPRNIGIQNAIQALDDLSEHLFREHSVAGAQSQTLLRTSDRTDLLLITTQTLRSETIDVDFAEASMELKQLELNYQAMLSTVSRISQLSLVNYL